MNAADSAEISKTAASTGLVARPQAKSASNRAVLKNNSAASTANMAPAPSRQEYRRASREKKVWLPVPATNTATIRIKLVLLNAGRRIANGQGEARRVGVQLPLVDRPLLVRVEELDRILDGEDVLGTRLVDQVDDGGKRR